jgi:hypothetical protein
MRPLLNIDQAAMTYAPTLWLNDFWLLRDKLLPMNATVTSANITFSLYSLPGSSPGALHSNGAIVCMQESSGAMQDGESDDLKRVLTEGNPYFLALTMVVSLLHSV